MIGPGKQGVLLEHREKEFGDKVNPFSVLEAVKKIKPQNPASGKADHVQHLTGGEQDLHASSLNDLCLKS